MQIRSIAAALAATGLVLVGMAGPAQAGKPFEKVDHYEAEFGFDSEECGLDLRFESVVSGRFSIHPTKSTEAFLAHDVYRFAETITLASDPDGPFVTTRAHGNFRETKAVQVDPVNNPNLYAFTSVDAGRFQMFDSSGRQIFSGNGVFKVVDVYDTGGDGAPGAEFVETISEVNHGNEKGDFCKALVGALT